MPQLFNQRGGVCYTLRGGCVSPFGGVFVLLTLRGGVSLASVVQSERWRLLYPAGSIGGVSLASVVQSERWLLLYSAEFLFRFVEVGVGLFDEVLERKVGGCLLVADADREVVRRICFLVQTVELAVDAADQVLYHDIAFSPDQDDELVAAVTRDERSFVVTFKSEAHGIGDAYQCLVALEVSVSVVDALELVRIDHEKVQGSVIVLVVVPHIVVVVDHLPVVKTGKRVDRYHLVCPVHVDDQSRERQCRTRERQRGINKLDDARDRRNNGEERELNELPAL